MKREENIVSYTAEELEELRRKEGDKTDWAKVDSMTQERLVQLIAEDPDERDLKPDWTKAQMVIPKPKQALSRLGCILEQPDPVSPSGCAIRV